jgi:hypothetical protein
MVTKPWSLQESFQNAWGRLLVDFRAWFIPDTDDGMAWQTKPISQAITAAKGLLVDDAEKMLAIWRQNNVGGKAGSSAYLPVMITAFEAGGSIPELSHLRSMPTAEDVIVGTDDQGRILKMRTLAMGIHAQVVIFAPNPHSALSIATQFITYLQSDQKRRVPLTFDLGSGIVDQWDMTVFDNMIYPSRIPSEVENISIIAIDVTLGGLVPQLIRPMLPASIVVESNIKEFPYINRNIFPTIDLDQDGLDAIPLKIGALFQAAGFWLLPTGTWTATCSINITNAAPPFVDVISVTFLNDSVSVVSLSPEPTPFYLSALPAKTAIWAAGVYECQLKFFDANGVELAQEPPIFRIEVLTI